MAVYLLVEHIDDVEIEYSGEGEPDPIVKKVLLDITQYQDGPCDIWIGDKLYAFEGRRMWPIDKLRGKWELTYDAQGEYFEDWSNQ